MSAVNTSGTDTSGTPGTPDTPGTTSRTAPSLRRPLRAELLRGVGPWAGTAVAVTIWVVMYSKVPQWQGRWTETTDLLRVVGLLLCGPVAAAAGCWQGGRERRRGTDELWMSFPRTRLRQALHALAPAALWPPAGYLVGASGCLLATWPYASGPPPFVSLIAADAVALAALGVLGFVAGRLIPWRLAAPVLGAVTYIALGLPAYTQWDIRWLDPATDHFYLWDRPVWWFGPASAVWTGGLAAAALLAYAARRRVLALLPLVLAFAAAVPIALAGEAVWRPDPEAARLVCDNSDDGTPQVCVTAVDRKLLPATSAALAGTNAKLRGVPGAPTRWVDGRSHRPEEVGLLTPADLAVRDRLPDPAYYANWAVGALFDDDCGRTEFDAPGWEQASAIHSAVRQWLAPHPNSAPPWPETVAHLKRLEAMNAEQGRAYLTRYLAADRCRADEVPVP
ncbi:hypothetical protein GT002_28410 [Streptomyces sp. SID4917]|nr:hypothetical protein [Streptomyces sp. SID4917]MYZ38923.1 hypothetical protein [Streptomyces sp. SID4917]SCG01126.1 hypothetical protein GA0115259_107234 [Streptomyces sp. MnatMP-M17]